MKSLLFLLLGSLFFNITNSIGQKNNAFYDAEVLQKKATQAGINVDAEILQILARYMNQSNGEFTPSEIQAAYSQNPFVGRYLQFNAATSNTPAIVYGQRGFSSDNNSLQTNGMGLSPSAFLMGLTDFLVQRTKQELHIAFFKEFNEKVKKSEELRILFPQTTETLITIESEIYRFNAFWDALRESFIQDLEHLSENLGDYFQKSSKIKDPKIKALGADCFEIMNMLKLKRPPTDIIDYLGNRALFYDLDSEDGSELAMLQNNLKLVCLFSQSLEYIDASKYWVSPDQFANMVMDTMHTDLFLGLIYQRGKDLKIGNKTLGSHLTTMRSDKLAVRMFLRTLRKFVEEGQLLFQQVQDVRRQTRNAERGNAKPISTVEKNYNFYSFAEKTINLVDYAIELQRHFVPDSSAAKQRKLYNNYIGSVRNLNKMIYDIQEKKYAVAIIEAIQIIQRLTPEGKLECERNILMKYGSFVAMAIRAKTPKEVSQAIEAFALPPGSSAIKKYSSFSLAINAYVGVGGGYEYLNGLQEKPFYAIATPVGISASWGFRQYGSISLFASIIDIGALTAFRFDPNNSGVTNPLPELKFENVFAPGAYLIYGVPKYPLSIGVGAQLGPNLRTVTAANGSTFQTSGFRMGAFIAVDIPITNLYSSSKQYRNCNRNN